MDATFYQPQWQKNNLYVPVDSRIIHRLLLDIGFPQHVYAYQYVIYALELIMKNPDILHHVTKELYPDIAKRFNTTSSRVERSIRSSIQLVWLYGNLPLIRTIYGNSIRQDKGVPTNSQLLAGLYYYLQDKCEHS